MQARTSKAFAHRSSLGLAAGAGVLAILCMDPVAARAERGSGSSGGALGQVTRAVSQSVSPPDKPSGGSSGGSSGAEPYRPAHVYYEPDYRTPYIAGAYCSTCAPAGRVEAQPWQPVQRDPMRVALSLGLQSVKDSDGATMGSLRITKGILGVAIAGTRYYEDAPVMGGVIHMNVWSLSAVARLLRSGDTELWVSGGVGETSSNQFERIMGATVGAELEHVLTPSLRVGGSARYYALEHDMRASELRAAVSASFLSLGYRVFRFNVGPALRGPEVGLALRF
jgi:hypothetical protein